MSGSIFKRAMTFGGTAFMVALVSCGEGDKETHGNLQADPNFDGSQDKLIPGSRHPGRPAEQEKAKEEAEEK